MKSRTPGLHLKIVSDTPRTQLCPTSRAVPSTHESAEYMADLLLELKEVAGQAGLRTLWGILEVAHAEAQSHVKAP